MRTEFQNEVHIGNVSQRTLLKNKKYLAIQMVLCEYNPMEAKRLFHGQF